MRVWSENGKQTGGVWGDNKRKKLRVFGDNGRKEPTVELTLLHFNFAYLIKMGFTDSDRAKSVV